jgi:Mn-dependent DtxR family transcriptional regulator
MNNLIKYLNDNFGIETVVVPLEKQLFQQLPLYITAAYKVQKITIYEQRVCLLIAKNQENISTPDRLSKQMLFVKQKIGLPVVYVFDKVASYNIKRMIRKGINFIVPNKQLFIPALMMDLRKTPDKIPQKIILLTPFAQFLLLYHLQKELLNGFTTQQLTKKFNQPYRTVSRAVKNLEELGICNLIGGKEKHLQFTAKGKNLWMLSQNVLQNPVERNLFTDKILNKKQICLSNISALAHYTMLNDEERIYFAVNKYMVKNLETNKYAGDNTIEVWRYNPYLLSDNGFVDKLSLYLLFKNNTDERIQNELEQMINEISWLEE